MFLDHLHMSGVMALEEGFIGQAVMDVSTLLISRKVNKSGIWWMAIRDGSRFSEETRCEFFPAGFR